MAMPSVITVSEGAVEEALDQFDKWFDIPSYQDLYHRLLDYDKAERRYTVASDDRDYDKWR